MQGFPHPQRLEKGVRSATLAWIEGNDWAVLLKLHCRHSRTLLSSPWYPQDKIQIFGVFFSFLLAAGVNLQAVPPVRGILVSAN